MATVPAPITWLTSTTLTAARFNTEIRDAINFLLAPPRCHVYRSTDQTISNNTVTAATFDSERFDNDSMHSTVTNTSRITFTTAGVYEIGGAVKWEQQATIAGVREAYFQVNGATIIQNDDNYLGAVSNGQNASRPIAPVLWQAAANDYVELILFQTSGGNLKSLAVASYAPNFWARWYST